MVTHIQMALIGDVHRKASVLVAAFCYPRGQMPDGSVQDPGWSEVRRVDQVVATLRVLPDPDTVCSCREERESTE